jgi:hypothetical protein
MNRAIGTIFLPLSIILALSVIVPACGGDGANQTGTCLTDGQICSLALGVTTKDDVLKRFGTPSQTSSATDGAPFFSYVCQRIDTNGVLLYSQGVGLQFDANTLLTNVVMTRSGPDATPVPACVDKLKS